jgi:hypothetical protein
VRATYYQYLHDGLDHPVIDLLNRNGNVVESYGLNSESLNFDFINPGGYSIAVHELNSCTAQSDNPRFYHLTLQIVGPYVSSDKDGLGGTGGRKQQDLLIRDYHYHPDGKISWELVFDASRVGITQDVTAAEFLPNGTLLLALGGAQKVPGLGKVQPQDIIRFVPENLGEYTAGTFQWYVDGSDVGLSGATEKIDAIMLSSTDLTGYQVVISTTGNGSAPKAGGGTLNFLDEDLIALQATQLGATTVGQWQMFVDGSTVPGMGAENLSGATLIRTPAWRQLRGALMMIMFDNYMIDGVAGGPKDVLHAWMDDGTLTPDVTGLAIPALGDKKLDAISLGPIVDN